MQLLEPRKGSQSRPDVIAAEFKSFQIPAINLNQKFLSAINNTHTHTHPPYAKSPHPLTLRPSRNPNHKPRQEPQNHPGSFLEVRRVNPLPELEAALCEQEGVLLARSVTLQKVVQRRKKHKKKEKGGREKKCNNLLRKREKEW